MAVVIAVLVVTGCGSVTQKNGAVEPDVNEIFKEMYSAVAVAASANGNEAKFLCCLLYTSPSPRD